MALESYRAAEKQIAAEKLAEQYPGMYIVIGLVKMAAKLGKLELSAFEELSLDAIQRNSRNNLAYLFESLVKDVERIDLKIEAFEAAGDNERAALNALVSEAVVRAAEAKSRDRVRRIARIVARALSGGPKQHYEAERELIDAAAQIAESDAFILGTMMKHQGSVVTGDSGIADINDANKTWKAMRDEHKEFRDPHIHVSCARLQAQGLIIQMERQATTLDLATNAYSLTTFGVFFCEWCLEEVAK